MANSGRVSLQHVLLLLLCGTTTTLAFKSSEIQVLQDIKTSVVDGKFWMLADWDATTDDSPCGWTGVSCQEGVNVSHLDLHGCSLDGTLPAALGSLESLQSLDVSGNSLRGTLPAALASLERLQCLNASDNQLRGSIPDLSGLRELKVVRLGGNSLSGTLTAALASLHLGSLEHLDLSANMLSGPIPEDISQARNLKTLELTGNGITGTIPGSFAQLRSLEALYLADNYLSGTLSAALAALHLRSLEDLDLSVNMFSGPIPEDVWAQAGNLKKLLLYSNRLTGRIPGGLSQLRSLELLYLSHNALSGSVSGLTGLRNLTHLDLECNRFSGGIADVVDSLTGLEWLNLGHNRLVGRLPSLNRSSNLERVDMSDNRLAGRVPGLSMLRNLTWLDLSLNRLEGEIVPSGMASGLQILNLSGNVLQGEISQAIAETLPDLSTLDLSRNRLSGRIPEELFRGLSKLDTLDLSFNRLTGSIPAGIGSNVSGVQVLALAYNDLTGHIPPEILRMPNLRELQLACNRLSGRISSDGRTAAPLERLDLSGNQLSGAFPSLLLQDNLTYLNLSRNCLNGSLDISRGRPDLKLADRQLETLDLSHNQLEGDLARTSLQHLPRLKELRLSNNSFRGDIPVERRMWRSLEVLDVSQNALNLSGRHTLQIILDTHTDLVELRVSNNMAAGSLPTSASNLDLLRVLDLSNSNLTGNLTQAFPVFNQTYLPALAFVNLSNNRLQGEIPPGFAQMRNLTYLDVSNNNLSGPLPHLPWLVPNVTFLFFGNQALCGALIGTDCPRPGSNGVQVKLWQLLAVVGASVVTLVGSFSLLAWRWTIYSERHRQDADLIAQLLDRDTATTLMSLQDLRRATNNFSTSCQIGEGGFGLVYRGVLDDGTTVAIKRSKLETTAEHKLMFLNEVKILSQVHHRNLVKLLGCCLEQRIALLVFEYVPNGNLEQHLRSEHRLLHCTGALSWRQRLKIAVQTADALAYLHCSASPPIFHLDVKSANVLLDQNLDAKVADFGVSRLAPAPDATHITALKVQGTVGYMDPDYFSTFKLTGKSDVYAFGVVLLELISARAAVDPGTAEKGDAALSSLAVRLFRSGDFHRLLDPALSRTFQSQTGCDSIWGVGRLAVRCLQGDPRDRPCMSEVLGELHAFWLHTHDPQSHSEGSRFDDDVFTPLPCRAFHTQSGGHANKQPRAHRRDVFTM